MRLSDAIAATEFSQFAGSVRRFEGVASVPYSVDAPDGTRLLVRYALDGEAEPGETVAELLYPDGSSRLIATQEGAILEVASDTMRRRSFRCPSDLWAWAATQGDPSSVTREALEALRKARTKR